MKNRYICLLLFMLFACQFVACISKCPKDQTLVNGICQCEKSKIFSNDKEKCVSCEKGQFIETHIDGYKSCVNVCQRGKSLDGINCNKTCILDRRTLFEKCLNYYSDCQNGSISSDRTSCIKKCSKDEETFQLNYFKQCIACPLGKKADVVEGLLQCVEICIGKEIYDFFSKRCITPSSCSKYLTENQSYCVKKCSRYHFLDNEEGKKIRQCQQKCDKMVFRDKYTQNSFCFNKCPISLIFDKQENKCLVHYTECKYKAVSSLNERECVFCEKDNFIDIKSGVCSKNCEFFSYKYNYQQFCTEQCPPDTVEDTEKKVCKVDTSKCKVAISADGEQCVEKCSLESRETVASKKFTDCFDPKKKEISHLRSDEANSVQYQQCEVCLDFYYAGDYSDQSTCQPRCDDDKITMFPQKTCTKEKADCKDYSMSADQKICYQKCIPPQILRQWQCIDTSECSGVNEIIDETTEQKECKDKTAKGYFCPFESADGKRCVSSSLSIKQVEKKVSESLPPNSSKK